MKYYLGMDIGGTKCAVVLGEKGSSSVKDKIRFDTRSERGWRTVVGELISSAYELLGRNGISCEDVIACGVSCGGPLNSETGVIMCPPNLPDWDNVPLAQMITDEFGFPCKVRNDADACALAEWQFGAGRGCRNMIFLTFGTGMGAGLILDGRLYSGTLGMAGEVGHTVIQRNGLPCPCGRHGCWEQYASASALKRMTAEAVAAHPDSILSRVVAENDGHVSGQSAFITERPSSPPTMSPPRRSLRRLRAATGLLRRYIAAAARSWGWGSRYSLIY